MALTKTGPLASKREDRERARTLREEERVRLELEAARRRERAAVAVPAAWLRVRAAGVLAWVLLAACWALAASQFTAGRTSGVVATVLVGLWLHAAAWWLDDPTLTRGAWYAAASLAPAAVLWVVDRRPLAVVVVLATFGAGVAWWVRVVRERRRLHPFAWAAAQLAEAAGDRRELHRILAPARTSSGLPARWYVPKASERRMVTLDDDEDEAEDVDEPAAWRQEKTFDPARVIGAALGMKVAVKVTRGIGVVTVADVSKLATEKRRYDAVLAKHIAGKVTALERGEDGKFERLEFTWPARMADRVTSATYQARVVRTLQSQIGESLTARWNLAKATAVLAPLPPLETRLPRPARDLQNPMKIAFGQQRGGVECIFDLDGTLPHIAIGGGTGAGKTVLARTLLLGLPRPAGAVVEVFPIDPKVIGFLGLDQLPGVHEPADNPKAIVDYLERVRTIMMRRYDDLKAGRVKRTDLVPLVLLIDEGEEMADILTDWWTSGEGKEDWQARRGMEKKPTGTTHPAMKVFLGSVLRLGRAAHVHVIACSQQFSTSWLSTSSRSQFGIRIAVSNLEASTSEMLFGSRIATSGLDGTTPGRAWVSIGRGAVPVEAQIYWTPEIEDGLPDEDRKILHQLGVRLPDDPADLVIPGEVAVDVDQDAGDDHAARGAAVAGIALSPAGDEPSATDDDDHDDVDGGDVAEDLDELTGVETPVLDLADGMRILVDIDGVLTAATVDDVAPDEVDENYLALSYTTDDEVSGVMSLADDELVTVLDESR